MTKKIMYDGHFIDDPLHVVNIKPDFSGLGMEPNHINKGTMTDEQKQQERFRIGQRIKALRTEAKIALADVAERAGLDAPHISRIEAGKYNVGIDALSAIAKAIGREVDFVTPPQTAE